MPTILSIEDSVFERKMIKKILTDNGYNDITLTENGESGIEKYKELNPDLVLLDLRLPDMDGTEVLKKIKEIGMEDTKIIIVSIVREEETIQELREMGADDYLPKPMNSEDLISKIEKALGE